jgi:hypothetical protein
VYQALYIHLRQGASDIAQRTHTSPSAALTLRQRRLAPNLRCPPPLRRSCAQLQRLPPPPRRHPPCAYRIAAAAGFTTQFTCFTSTKVQILTQKLQLAATAPSCPPPPPPRLSHCCCSTRLCVSIPLIVCYICVSTDVVCRRPPCAYRIAAARQVLHGQRSLVRQAGTGGFVRFF